VSFLRASFVLSQVQEFLLDFLGRFPIA
jgi:hypothetical protein